MVSSGFSTSKSTVYITVPLLKKLFMVFKASTNSSLLAEAGFLEVALSKFIEAGFPFSLLDSL